MTSRPSVTPTCDVNLGGKNHILDMLPAAERTRLLNQMVRRSVRHREPVFERHTTITHVHFPLSAVISLVTVMEDGTTSEIGTIGNEGFAGLAVLFGNAADANEAFYQIPGETLIIPRAKFERALAGKGSLRGVAQRYAQAFFTQLAQTTACNRLHSAELRLARWILMSHDRVGGGTIALTQEFLAQMLGVRRPAVSVVAGALQSAGLIRYSRGIIEVLDRARLEEACCECYSRVKEEFQRLLC